jgi:hypothetical protein
MALPAQRDSVPHFGHLECLKADLTERSSAQLIAPLDQKSSLSKRLS